MLRLLGILSIVNLLSGGRRRRALRRGILLGAVLGFFAHRDFDAKRAAEDIREKAEKARETAGDVRKAMRHTVKEARREIREAKKEFRDAKREAREARRAGLNALKAEREAWKDGIAAIPQEKSAEAAANEEIVQDLERNARTAAMMSNVPTLHFPEDDPKYNSSRKYRYA